MSTPFPDSGFVNENLKKTSDTQPAWRGTINVSPALAEKIAKDGKFDIAMWERPVNQYGKSFSAKISVAWKKPDDGNSRPAPPSKPAAIQMDDEQLSF